ncbi:hypothetical protein [Variovorax sp. N23]|uniref:restriction endonuclease n=1 Tax=Variovorax sp. N23 TaxID=2980555 RepID=UPI0021C922E8|nr:hypothetical protein [Variovorax sp. N23]MCU4119398.1 hypothetical protein [Variovorax sp. N23]
MELIDNINRLLGDDLKRTIRPGGRLKIAASCFSMYAYEALKDELEKVEHLSFIFTSPTFVAEEATDKIRKERREFHIPRAERERSLYGSEFEIQLRNKLTQRAIAKECADWLRRKATFKSNRSKAPMQQFACVQVTDADATAYMPLHGFTAVDLGYQPGNAVSNLVNKMDEPAFTATWLSLFDQIWSDSEKLEDVAEGTLLTRRTVVEILKGINAAVFAQFKTNPENFIAEAIRLINEQKATVIIEHLAYDAVDGRFDLDIFTTGQTKQDFSKAGEKLTRHIYDFVLTDSKVERDFVTELDTCKEVVVYAKLPRGFLIPTPVGDYNPDWAISFQEGAVKHVYFVAETKGSMSSMDLRPIEATKIQCARKFFEEINRKFAPENVKYDVVDSFGKLMELVK